MRNVEVATINEIYNMSVNVYLINEGQIIQPQTVTVSQAVNERNVSNNHYDAVLPVEEKQKLGIFGKICFHKQTSPKTPLLSEYCYSIKSPTSRINISRPFQAARDVTAIHLPWPWDFCIEVAGQVSEYTKASSNS
jgi:predicted RNA methylase